MPSAVTLQTVGDWQRGVATTMQQAVAVSADVSGRTGEEACKHCIILMAQSARADARKSQLRRQVLYDMRLHGAEYVEVWNQGKREPSRLYRWRFSDAASAKDRIPGTWNDAKKIGNRGLAGRSWMWGLRSLGKSAGAGRAIPNVAHVFPIKSETSAGYILTNRLSYIDKAMAPGWEARVSTAATNKLMKQSAMRIERQWEARVRRGERAVERAVGSFFRA